MPKTLPDHRLRVKGLEACHASLLRSHRQASRLLTKTKPKPKPKTGGVTSSKWFLPSHPCRRPRWVHVFSINVSLPHWRAGHSNEYLFTAWGEVSVPNATSVNDSVIGEILGHNRLRSERLQVQPVYMLTSSGCPLLSWGIFYRFRTLKWSVPLLQSWTSFNRLFLKLNRFIRN